jgi:uncharacterized protein (TIGR02099 family)
MRWLFRLLLAMLLLVTVAWGALQFWIVPRIADLRPQLEMMAARALGVPVRVGHIAARSGGMVPSFELHDVQLLDAQGRAALGLPRVLAALSARSLLRLDFEQLYIERPTLEVRRTKEGRLLVAGLDFSRGETGADSPAANWFFSQHEFVIRGGTVRWVDERNAAEPLELGAVDFVLRNSARRHDMRLDATPPEGWGDRLQLAGQFRRPLLSVHAGRWEDWDGQIFADLPRVDVSRLRLYAGLGAGVDVREGRGALRAWIDVSRGMPVGGAADLALEQVTATLGAGLEPLGLQSVAGRIGGKRLAGGFQIYTEGLQFQTREGLRWPGGNLAVSHTQAEGRTPALGELRADRLDLAALSQIANSLPLGTVTHALLQAHPVKGLVQTVQARWQGPLTAPEKYEVRGRVEGLEVAASPASGPATRRPAAVGVPPPVGTPGIRGATLDIDMNQSGGKGRLVMAQGALELPGVFEDPLLPFDRLAAEVQWQVQGDRIVMPQLSAKFANADAEGEFSGSWQTSDPARAASGSRFPGVLDVQGRFSRADGARVHRYLPLGIPADARHYVRDAVIKGSVSDLVVRIKGDLYNIPFSDPKQGEFRFGGKVRNGTYAYVPRNLQPREQAPWPVLTDLNGELVFDRSTMRVLGATARLAGSPGLQITRAEAQIPDFMNTTTVVVSVDAKGPVSEVLGIVNNSPLGEMTGKALSRTTASGDAAYQLRLNLPIHALEKSQVRGSVTLAGNDVRMMPTTPLMGRARGLVTFSESGFAIAGAQARMLGGDLRVEGGSRVLPPGAVAGAEPSIVLRAQGSVTAEGLRQAAELGFVSRLAQQATGSAAYAAVLAFRRGVPELTVSSNLQGLGLTLPAPLGKPADAVLPLRFENTLLRDSQTAVPGGAARLHDQLQLELGRLVSVAYVRDIAGPEPRVLRGAIGIGLAPGESAPMPEEGVVANINLANVNIDAWEGILSRAAGTPLATQATPGANGNGASGGAATLGYLPTTMAVRAAELTAGGRTLHQVVIGGARDGLTWRANVNATQLNGYVEYRQPSSAGPGRVYARLARLAVAPGAASDVEALLDKQPAALPALDIVVEDFELRGKKLGRVEVEAINRGGSVATRDGALREWRLNKFNILVPEASFTGTGNWAAVSAQAPEGLQPAREGVERRRTVMNFKLDIADSGALLARFGMKDVIRRGKGKLEGQVTWAGSPLSPDYPSLGGQFNVNVEAGQFLQAEPGIAKLLGVLSLQSLPRRLALDFRDVFSEGFAFDFVRGDVGIAQGMASTNNLQMKGVNAAVLMEGRADIARETQDLRVVVVPEINAGTASLVMAVINPAVGLGTVLAQMFLRRPLMQAATQEFHVDGTWADPRITKVVTRPAATDSREAVKP